MPVNDLIISSTGPYVAGLDTVANTTAAITYTVLKHPEVLRRVHEEVDALFASGTIDEEDLLKRIPSLQGAIMETMRLYPIAVAQMRTATKDFVFEGHQIYEGEMIYVGTSVPHFMQDRKSTRLNPVTNAQLVCRLLLETKKNTQKHIY